MLLEPEDKEVEEVLQLLLLEAVVVAMEEAVVVAVVDREVGEFLVPRLDLALMPKPASMTAQTMLCLTARSFLCFPR